MADNEKSFFHRLWEILKDIFMFIGIFVICMLSFLGGYYLMSL